MKGLHSTSTNIRPSFVSFSTNSRLYFKGGQTLKSVYIQKRFIHPHGPIESAPVPGKLFDILFFGRDEFSCQVLKKLHEATGIWRALHVVTMADIAVHRRGLQKEEAPLKRLAIELGLPYYLTEKGATELKKLHFKLKRPFENRSSSPLSSKLLITASFGQYIPKSALKKFLPSRKLNLHPSLIPKYRGAAPIQWSIIDGADETGVSVIEMEQIGRGWDVGDIWDQKKVKIPAGSTYRSLETLLADEGSELLINILRRMLDGTQPDSIEQIPEEATHAPMIQPIDCRVDWSSWDAGKVERFSRAVVHQRPIFTYIDGTDTNVQLFDVEVASQEISRLNLLDAGTATLDKRTGKLFVVCARQSLVSIGRLKQRDKNLIDAKDWWNGVWPERKKDGILWFSLKPQSKLDVDEEHPDID